MKITKEQLKNIVRETLQEESEYQTFFKKALEKAGKSIPSMSDEEKKAFFNKIEKTWKGRGQKSEGNAFGAAVAQAKKDGDDSFEVDGKEYKTERFGRGHEGPTFGSEEESVNEGKKRFNTKYGVGKSKYVVNYHDGKKKHKDGSDFFDIKIFKNKPELEAFKKDLVSKGFVKESVNEAKYTNQTGIKSALMKDSNFSSLLNPKEIKWINGSDVKIYKGIGMNFSFTDGKSEMIVNVNKPMSIVKKLGKVGNDVKKVYQQNESVINEGPSTEEKKIAMLAVRKQAKYRNVSLEQAIQDQINALEDLKRDVKKGKLK